MSKSKTEVEYYFDGPSDYDSGLFVDLLDNIRSYGRMAAEELKCRIKDLHYEIKLDYTGCWYPGDMPEKKIVFSRKQK